MEKNVLDFLDKSKEDYEEVKEFCKLDFLSGSPGYGNGHKECRISDLDEKDFDKIVRALMEFEKEKPYNWFGECEFSSQNGKKYLLKVSTAKDYDKEMLNAIVNKCGFENKPTYYQDCWDCLANIEFDKKNCKLVYMTAELTDPENCPACYNMDIIARDNASDVLIGFGGGCISAETAFHLYNMIKDIEKADDYEERDLDLSFLDYEDPEIE